MEDGRVHQPLIQVSEEALNRPSVLSLSLSQECADLCMQKQRFARRQSVEKKIIRRLNYCSDALAYSGVGRSMGSGVGFSACSASTGYELPIDEGYANTGPVVRDESNEPVKPLHLAALPSPARAGARESSRGPRREGLSGCGGAAPSARPPRPDASVRKASKELSGHSGANTTLGRAGSRPPSARAAGTDSQTAPGAAPGGRAASVHGRSSSAARPPSASGTRRRSPSSGSPDCGSISSSFERTVSSESPRLSFVSAIAPEGCLPRRAHRPAQFGCRSNSSRRAALPWHSNSCSHEVPTIVC